MTSTKRCFQEAERESISAQMTLEEAQEETEALMNSLLEAESVTSLLCVELQRKFF